MYKKICPPIFIVFCSFFSFFIISPSYAQTVGNQNLCTQQQCVKIQNGRLWVLSSDNVTYIPYFVKAVGYQPTPIGRYPSDWGYAPTDPRSSINNIFDDPEILNRDFSLLQQMNANTIRVWKGDNTLINCQCTNNGRFPNYITNASTTINKDTTQNTLDLAASYGLKVIAGFWVNPLTFDANNNIGSSDENGNPLIRQQIINNFVNYVNTFKGNRAILFWSIGNENNYQVLNSGKVSITAFENAFGQSYGDTIFNWLQQTGNFLDFDGDIIVDLNSSAIVDELMNQYPEDYNSILNVLKQFSGQKLTPQQLTAWYGLIDAMALAAHQAEGATYHPVAVVNGEITEIGNSADGATDSQLPDLDIWGGNEYRGESFGTLFSEYTAKSKKPLWISEFGIDAWSVTNAAGINDWGLTLTSDLGGRGTYDPVTQSAWDLALWNEIFNNYKVTIGGSVMEYSDEWWKPYEFYCTNPDVSQTVNAASAGICNSNQKYFGNPFPAFPDDFMNQDWFGVVAISPNSFGDPDIVTPRSVYSSLQAKWAPPAILSGSPSGTLPFSFSLTISVTTNENAVCKYLASTNAPGPPSSDPSYSSMPDTFASTGGTVHTQGISAVSAIGTYQYYYVACQDQVGDITPNDYVLSFIVSPPSTPSVPVLSTWAYGAYTGLHWTASSAGQGVPVAYEVFRVEQVSGKDVGSFVQVATTDSTIWADTTAVTGMTYQYYVKAFVTLPTTPTSAASNIVTATVPVPTLIFNAYVYGYTAPAFVFLSVAESESGSNISKIEFFNGSTLINTSPILITYGGWSSYYYVWSGLTPGNYSVTAKAIDGNNYVTSSAPVTFTINGLPTVSLISSSYSASAGANITLTANAAESYGTIRQVKFYKGSVLLGTSTTSPYTYSWKNVPAGNYKLTAQAFDNSNNMVTSKPITVIVNPSTATLTIKMSFNQ